MGVSEVFHECFMSVSFDRVWSISRMGEVAPTTSQSYSHLRAQPKHPAIHRDAAAA